jgi:Domain of unknown function (DUF4263)
MADYIDENGIRSYAGFNTSVGELATMIDDGASEAMLQSHLATNRYILSQQFAHCHHVFPRVRLGNQYEADFFCLDIPSSGYEWWGVELEAPNKKVITKAGRKTADVEHALQQVRDWRTWLTQNLSYAQGTLRLERINPRFFGYVIIGRWKDYTDEFNNIRSQVFRDELIQIRSWDGIIEWARKRARFFRHHG